MAGPVKYTFKIGSAFGRLTVCGDPVYVGGLRRIPVLCACGTQKTARAKDLVSGVVVSCGCAKRERAAQMGRASAGRYGEASPRYHADGKTAKKAWLRAQKEVPCTDCNVQYPWYTMQFDHVPERGSKSFRLVFSTKRTLAELATERAKCDVVCSNCHDRRTYLRANGLPVTLPLWRVEPFVNWPDSS